MKRLQLTMPESEGWEHTPTPCPSCGRRNKIQVRRLDDGRWEYHCTGCKAEGHAEPRP